MTKKQSHSDGEASTRSSEVMKIDYLIKAKRGRRPKPPRTCASCFTTNSSQWRTGPNMETLCNKCGIASRRCQRTGRDFVPVFSADPSKSEDEEPSEDRIQDSTYTSPLSPEYSSTHTYDHYTQSGSHPIVAPTTKQSYSPSSYVSAPYQEAAPESRAPDSFTTQLPLPSFSTLASACLSP